MFYIIEDNSHRIKTEESLYESFLNEEITFEEYLEESAELNEGKFIDAAKDSLLGKTVEMTSSQLKQKVEATKKAVEFFYDDLQKKLSDLNFRFKNNYTSYAMTINRKLDSAYEKALKKGKFVVTIGMTLPAFNSSANPTRGNREEEPDLYRDKIDTKHADKLGNVKVIQSKFMTSLKAAEAKMPKEFSIGIAKRGMKKDDATSFAGFFSMHSNVISERIILTDVKK